MAKWSECNNVVAKLPSHQQVLMQSAEFVSMNDSNNPNLLVNRKQKERNKQGIWIFFLSKIIVLLRFLSFFFLSFFFLFSFYLISFFLSFFWSHFSSLHHYSSFLSFFLSFFLRFNSGKKYLSVGCVLWYVNHCGLFNAADAYIKYVWFINE